MKNVIFKLIEMGAPKTFADGTKEVAETLRRTYCKPRTIWGKLFGRNSYEEKITSEIYKNESGYTLDRPYVTITNSSQYNRGLLGYKQSERTKTIHHENGNISIIKYDDNGIRHSKTMKKYMGKTELGEPIYESDIYVYNEKGVAPRILCSV